MTNAMTCKCGKRLSRKTARMIDGEVMCSSCLFPPIEPSRIDTQELEDFLSDVISDSIDMDWTARVGAQAVIREMEREGLRVVRIAPQVVGPDGWNPEADDPFWMLESPAGEWLKNRHTGSFTRDPAKAARFPSMQHADMIRRSLSHPLWGTLKPTEHLWTARDSDGIASGIGAGTDETAKTDSAEGKSPAPNGDAR